RTSPSTHWPGCGPSGWGLTAIRSAANTSSCSRRRPSLVAADRGVRWLAPILVVLVTLAAFLPTLQNGFVSWDDSENLLTNAHYRGLAWTHLRWMWTTFHVGHYMPLTWMTLGLDYVIGGMNPVGYHLTSLVLHATNA